MVPNESGLLDITGGALKAKILSHPILNCSRGTGIPTFTSGSGTFFYDFVELHPLIDSSCMSPEYYARLVSYIHECYEIYSAFVILHGTDTLAYTAPMLDLFIENLNKPIFITGSVYSIFETESDSDAYGNLLSTFNYVCRVKRPGVYVSFCNKLFCSETVRKFSSVIADMFSYRKCLCETLENIPEVLECGNSLPFPTRFVVPSRIKIASLYITPVDHLGIFDRLSLCENEILLIHGYGNGNVPYCRKLFGLIESHSRNGGITIVISQCPDSLVKPLYSSWERLNDLGAVPSGSMTIEFLVAKISYLISKGIPWNLMELMIYINLDQHYKTSTDLHSSDFCAFAMKMLKKRGHMSKYALSVSQRVDEAVRDRYLDGITEGDLSKILENPLLCFHIFREAHRGDCMKAISEIDHLALRSLFISFELLAKNGHICNE